MGSIPITRLGIRWFMKRQYAKIISHVIATTLCFCSPGVFAEWGYLGNTGPSKWGQLDPGFAMCARGKLQAPINITKKFKTAPYELKINYQPASMTIVNDGATSLTIGSSQVITQHGHGIQLNFPQSGVKETITFKNRDYRLVQLDVHTPSETAFNNQTFPMEIHFIHQGDDGQVVIMTVLAKAGVANSELQKIVNHFPADTAIEHVINSEKINPAGLLPARHDYYSFTGSLTTPPCAEGVQWIVMRDFITVSTSQIVLFRKAVRGDNARPIQPGHKRDVYFSVENGT
jgi:carbonic anhydrase